MSEHIEELIKHINQDRFDEEINNIIDNMLNDYLSKHIKGIWNEGFKLSTSLYDFVLEILSMSYEILNSGHINNMEGNECGIKVLRLLSDGSLRTFKSVLILIKMEWVMMLLNCVEICMKIVLYQLLYFKVMNKKQKNF